MVQSTSKVLASRRLAVLRTPGRHGIEAGRLSSTHNWVRRCTMRSGGVTEVLAERMPKYCRSLGMLRRREAGRLYSTHIEVRRCQMLVVMQY